MRVLHGPVNVGNQPWVLSRSERRLGLRSDLVVNYGTWLQYSADRTLASYGERSWARLARRAAFAATAPWRYDVIHYYFGRSFLSWDDRPDLDYFAFADLKMAKRLGKTLVMTLQGCDARVAQESNRNNKHTPCQTGRCSVFEACVQTYDVRRRRLIEDVLPLCDRVFYLNPELGRFVPNGEFMPYANVDVRAYKPALLDTNRRPRIVHAPSDGAIKGTPLILAAIERLKARYDFEFILIQNMSHADALALYRSADLAIDQLYAGWYGGFAVEVMAMGIPVACYIREEDRELVSAAMWDAIPVLRISPETIEADLANILENRPRWPAIGQRSRQYALDWHDPDMIAAALKRVYLDPKASFALGTHAPQAIRSCVE